MSARLRYAEHRPYLVPERLEELTGPTDGTAMLPSRLDWSGGRRTYNLAVPAERNILYERVIREALALEDLDDYLNAEVLLHVWRHLCLPVRVRQLWEHQFPRLAQVSA